MWLGSHPGGNARAEIVRVMTFNVLADKYVRPDIYQYVRDPTHLQWAARREVLLREILAESPKIVCLQVRSLCGGGRAATDVCVSLYLLVTAGGDEGCV